MSWHVLATCWINPWANGLAHKKPNPPWIIIFPTRPISWRVGSGLGRVYGSGLTSLVTYIKNRPPGTLKSRETTKRSTRKVVKGVVNYHRTTIRVVKIVVRHGGYLRILILPIFSLTYSL
jgi:hypothetical protein